MGENGAGKTTLVKLLCGPAPSEFRQHRDRRPVSRRAARDHLRHLPGLSAPGGPTRDDRSRRRQRLRARLLPRARCAWARECRRPAAAPPGGLRAQLDRSYADGEELSGGQWQKIAIARSLIARDPHLLILDEPTASLDAEAEDALLARYAQIANRTVLNASGITILISHRLSTVGLADYVAFLADGKLVEFGTHRELLALNGRYADLYRD